MASNAETQSLSTLDVTDPPATSVRTPRTLVLTTDRESSTHLTDLRRSTGGGGWLPGKSARTASFHSTTLFSTHLPHNTRPTNTTTTYYLLLLLLVTCHHDHDCLLHTSRRGPRAPPINTHHPPHGMTSFGVRDT